MKTDLKWKKQSLPACAALLIFSTLAALSARDLSAQTNERPVNRAEPVTTSFAPVIKKVAPSVVNIYSTKTVRQMPMPFSNDPWHRFFGGEDAQRPRSFRTQGLGSGVIVSGDGYVLTANHVVEGAEEINVKLPTGGMEFTAKIVGADPATDVAVLKVDGTNLPAATMADSDKLEVGDIVLAIGNPFAVGQTVTMGIVSGVGRNALGITDYENFIQTDAAINPGNSGGALVDAEGRVIGINTAIFSRSGGNQGLGFAVPINLARAVMDRLIKFGKVTHGYLGVSLQDLTPALAQEFNLQTQAGALVGGVQSDTPAANAGLKPGDLITEFNGQKVMDSRQLRLAVGQTPPQTKATVKIIRAGNSRTLNVTLTERPENLAQTNPLDDAAQPGSSEMLEGVEVANLDAGMRQQLNVPNTIRNGVVVVNVEPDSESYEKGLRQGDIILEANRQPVRDVNDLSHAAQSTANGRILLRVWRDGGSRFVVIESPRKPQ